MTNAMFSNVFWAAGFLGELALTFVLFQKHRWKQFPVFTALTVADAGMALIYFVVNRPTLIGLYPRIYWTYYPINFLLQLAVVVELARVVLRPTGTWVKDARKQFVLSAALGTLIALALAFLVAPPAPTPITQLEVRANLFTSMLICELFIAMNLAANRLGLAWKSHVMAIGQGLTAWSTMATIIDSLHSYLGATRYYEDLDLLRSAVYVGALGYWCVQLWHEEPARQPISPELRKYIVALHQRVNYDLGEAER